jgi:hypothetical protein
MTDDELATMQDYGDDMTRIWRELWPNQHTCYSREIETGGFYLCGMKWRNLYKVSAILIEHMMGILRHYFFHCMQKNPEHNIDMLLRHAMVMNAIQWDKLSMADFAKTAKEGQLKINESRRVHDAALRARKKTLALEPFVTTPDFWVVTYVNLNNGETNGKRTRVDTLYGVGDPNPYYNAPSRTKASQATRSSSINSEFRIATKGKFGGVVGGLR